MQEKKLEMYIFFGLLALTLYLVFSIFKPYITVLALSMIFAVIFYPLYQKILARISRHNSLASFLTGVIVVVLVLVPLVFFGIQLSDEVKSLYDNAFRQTEGQGMIYQLTGVANNFLRSFNPLGVNWPVFEAADTESYILNFLAWMRGHVGDIFSGLAKVFVAAFLFFISFFYFLRDGEVIRKNIITLSPFQDDKDEMILHKLKLAIVSIIEGSIFVALIQGILTGIGFFIFGIPSAALWGGVAIVSALIPGVGTSLVLIPGVLYLLFVGQTGMALGLLAWAILFVSLIDNFLGPKLIGKGIHIHPLLVMLAAIGGIAYFGVTGFILGPIVLSFLFTLFDIYKTIIVKDNK